MKLLILAAVFGYVAATGTYVAAPAAVALAAPAVAPIDTNEAVRSHVLAKHALGLGYYGLYGLGAYRYGGVYANSLLAPALYGRVHAKSVLAPAAYGGVYANSVLAPGVNALTKEQIENFVNANILGGRHYFDVLRSVVYHGVASADIATCAGAADGVYTYGSGALLFCSNEVPRIQSCPAGTANSLKDVVYGSVIGTKQMMNLCGVSAAEVAYLGL